MTPLPTFIKQATINVDGYGKLGTMEEAKLPDLKDITEEWRAGGMLGAIEVELGTEAMEWPFKIGGVDTQLYKLWANKADPVKSFQLLGHAVQEDTNVTMGVSAYIRGRLRELETDEYKSGSQSMISGVVSVRYYRLIVEGEQLLEYDPLNLVLKSGDDDQLEAMRANLGVGST